jgi:general nucleoside transport system ATP-binding protein
MNIDVENITLKYGDTPALIEATLWGICTKQIHAFVGPNGSGKTSLLKCLSGTIEKSANLRGNIFFDGNNVTDLLDISFAHWHGVILVQQEPELVESLTALQNIVLGKESVKPIFRWDMEKDIVQVGEVMADCGLHVPIDTLVKYLSASQKQKVIILQALYQLINNSSVNFILFDEPTTHLTECEIESLLTCLQRFKISKDIGFVIVTHNIDSIAQHVDKVTIFNKECIHCSYSADEYFEKKRPLADEEVIASLPIPSSVNQDALLFCDVVVETSDGEFGLSFDVTPGQMKIITGSDELLDDLFYFLVGMPQFNCWNGKLVIDKKSIFDLSIFNRRKLGIGMMSSDKTTYGIFGSLTVHENLALRPLSDINFLYSSDCFNSTNHLLCKFNIDPEKIDKMASSLSGGNKQRLIIAREHAQSPDLLILRQPTQGLDVDNIEEISSLLASLLQEGHGIIVLGGSDLLITGTEVSFRNL